MRTVILKSIPSDVQHKIPENYAKISKLIDTVLTDSKEEIIIIETHEHTISIDDLKLIAEYLCKSQGVDLPVLNTFIDGIYEWGITLTYRKLYTHTSFTLPPESTSISENKEKHERYNLLKQSKDNFHKQIYLNIGEYIEKLKDKPDFPYVASYFDIPGLVSLSSLNTCLMYDKKSLAELESILKDQKTKNNVCSL
jgi:hypothetical protein